VPALRIGRISPLEGMSRNPPASSGSWSWLFVASGLALIASGGAIVYGSVIGQIQLDYSKYGGIALLIGLVFLQTVLLPPQARFVAWLMSPLAKVESGLALKQILRHNTRSALTVGVLFIAGATGIGIANSILDNVKDVRQWYGQAIVADYFVRAMMPDMATGLAADLPDGIGAELEKVVGPRDTLDGIAFIEAKVPAPSGEPSDALTAIVVARGFPGKQPPAFDLIEGDASRLREDLKEGKIVIGSVLAHKLNLHVGDQLPLETAGGTVQLPIAGVANEYMVGGLAVHMHRDWAAKYLGVEGVDGYAIKADPTNLVALKAPLEAIAKKHDVLLQSNADITRSINRMVNGVEWSLWLLVFLGFVVAAFGIVNTLTMNVLEQTRELGLLRIVAMTKSQVRRTIRMQALIIGGVGLPAGLAVGVVNAYIMNQSMEPLLGHPIEFHLYPGLLIGTFLGAVLIVLVAAIIPARRAARIDVVEALHYE
jgi:putative ABC transport system permease protein